MSELCYLASPYSKFPLGREQAELEVSDKAAQLMLQGYKIFCPIAHSHAIEMHMEEIQTGDFWLDQDFAVLQVCDKLLVYKMPGWKESVGVQAEIAFAQEMGIPIDYLEYAE